MKLYRDKQTGEKLYPTCSWEKNQHKLHYWYTKAQIRGYDGDDDAWDEVQEIQDLLDIFNFNVHDGLVYAPYKAYVRIKELIVCYDLCH